MCASITSRLRAGPCRAAESADKRAVAVRAPMDGEVCPPTPMYAPSPASVGSRLSRQCMYEPVAWAAETREVRARD